MIGTGEEEGEFVELKVRVPKSVVNFVRDKLLMGQEESKYWTNTVMRAVGADVDDKGYLFEDVEVLKRYGLSKEDFDC